MKRLLLCILFGCVLVSPALAQESEASDGITGRVVAAGGGQGLAGASVALLRDGRVVREAHTDGEGAFALEGARGESTVLRVRLLGYEQRIVPVEPARRVGLTVELEPSPISLEPIEIIGGSAVAHRAMTGTATRIEPEAVRQIKPIGTQELLQYVPGISAFADDGIGNSRLSIGIRGLNPRRSSRVLVLEDGVPVQPAIYVYPNMYYNPPAERIERVEVIKGSAAVRYGPQTMGGVVNYITKRPRSEFGALSEATVGTNGYFSLFTEAGGWGSREWKPEIQLLYKRGDGFRDNNGFEQYNATAKLHLLPSSEKAVYVKANVNHENSNATYTGLTEYSFRTDPNFNPKEHDNFRVFRASLDVLYTDQHSDRLTSTTKAYINFFDREWWRENDVFVRATSPGSGAATPVAPYEPGDLVRVGGGVDNLGILREFYVGGLERSYQLTHSLWGGEGMLELGARYHRERFLDDKKSGSAPDARDGVYYVGDPEDPESVRIVGQSHHYETSALALYAAERVELGPMTVLPGVRFELFEQERIDRLQGSQYRDKTSWVVLPGIGLNYAAGAFNVFGGVHRGYTPPSSGTLKVVNFGGDVASGGLDLRPEKSWNWEAGVRGALSWVAFEAAGFYIGIEDLVAAGRGTAFKNLGRVRSYGLELGATVPASTWGRGLPDLNVSYTYLETDVLEGTIRSAVRAGGAEADLAGKDLPYAPRHTLVAGLAKAVGPWALRADARFVDEVFTDFENIRVTYNRGDTGLVPSYVVVDAGASYRVSDRVRLSLAAKNLRDRVYIGSRLHSNPGQPQAHLSSGIIPGPRRQVNLSLSYQF